MSFATAHDRDDVVGVYLASRWSLRGTNSGADCGLLRVSETSGVETHTHHAVSHVRAWLSGVEAAGCMLLIVAS